MSPLPSQPGGSGREVILVQQLIVGVAVAVVGLLLGRLISQDFILPVAMVIGFGLMVLLLRSPRWFVLLAVFVFYGTMRIVDTEVVGRVAGLFRLKDVFLVMMVIHILATEVIHRSERVVPRTTLAFRLFVVFMAWIGFQMWRTVVLLGEDKMLMFRVGRHFFTYGFFFFILYYLRREQDWKLLNRYMYALAILVIFLGLMSAVGANTTLYPRGMPKQGGFFYGVFKFYSPGESIVFAMFMYSFWRFCFRPTWRNGFLAAMMAGGCTLFVFRARLAGVGLGMMISMFFAPAKVRGRAMVLGFASLLSIVAVISVFGLIAANVTDMGRQTYLGVLAEYFEQAARGVTHRDTDDVIIREFFVQTRWSLVKKHPFLGMGFVSPFGKVAWDMYRMGDMPIGHVDVGWMDALMSLGGIGTLILSIFLISAAVEGKKLLTLKNLKEEEYAFGLTMVGFVVLMFVSTYSFAYPTREEHILTFSLLLAWIMHARRRVAGLPAKSDGGEVVPERAISADRRAVIRPGNRQAIERPMRNLPH